jgi:hypothetical protein
MTPRGAVRPVVVDLATADGPATLLDTAGPIDILVKNVGGAEPRTGGFVSSADVITQLQSPRAAGKRGMRQVT